MLDHSEWPYLVWKLKKPKHLSIQNSLRFDPPHIPVTAFTQESVSTISIKTLCNDAIALARPKKLLS